MNNLPVQGQDAGEVPQDEQAQRIDTVSSGEQIFSEEDNEGPVAIDLQPGRCD